jgi:hypothetical protein
LRDLPCVTLLVGPHLGELVDPTEGPPFLNPHGGPPLVDPQWGIPREGANLSDPVFNHLWVTPLGIPLG